MRLPNGRRLYTAQYGNWTEWPPGRRTPLYSKVFTVSEVIYKYILQ